MKKVSIVGAGMIPVGEHWDKGLRELAAEAGIMALNDAGIQQVDAVYVGNAFGATFNQQTQIGALVADFLNLSGVEAYTCDAGEASGGVALRTGYMAVASGLVKTALVIGVEKVTDIVGSARTSASSVSLDADFETANGATMTAMAGLLMRRYMHEYGVELSQFEGFSVNAHRNGKRSEYAMFRNTIREGAFSKAPMIAEPVSLFDSAPDADGAAAVVLTTSDVAGDMVPDPIHIAGSAVATDRFMIQERETLLWLEAVARSSSKALAQSQLNLSDMHFLELHDAYTILTAMSFEAMGLSERGRGWEHASNNGERIGLEGSTPISTFGGLKSRGNPIGATGVYQAVEATIQLRGQAQDNQVTNAHTALIQNLGALGTTAVTHILTKH